MFWRGTLGRNQYPTIPVIHRPFFETILLLTVKFIYLKAMQLWNKKLRMLRFCDYRVSLPIPLAYRSSFLSWQNVQASHPNNCRQLSEEPVETDIPLEDDDHPYNNPHLQLSSQPHTCRSSHPSQQCCGAGAVLFGRSRSREKRGGSGSSSRSSYDPMFEEKIEKNVNNNVN